MVEHNRLLDVNLLHTSVPFSLRFDAILWLVCPNSYGTTLFLVHVRNTKDLTGIALHVR